MINGAAANILDFGADPTGVADSTAALVVTMSGLSIQETQISGASLPIFWSITRIV